MPKKDGVSAQKRKLLDKAGTAPNQKKLNGFFVVQADVQHAEPEVLDVVHALYTDIDKPSQIGNNQIDADPVVQEQLDNTATVDEDVDINFYPQEEATEFETNVNKHHLNNSDTQGVEWSDWIRTEEEFTWTVR